jgi:hypothetical protein
VSKGIENNYNLKMSKGLGLIERKVLEYFTVECDERILCREPAKTAYTGELCMFVSGMYKCRCDSENHRIKTEYSKATYISVLRATKSLERKGLLKRQKIVPRLSYNKHTWFMKYEILNVNSTP